MSQREMLNIKQVQQILDISERTAFRLINSGELKGFKVGREWRFYQSDIDNYIERQRRKAEERLSGGNKAEDDVSRPLVGGATFSGSRLQPRKLTHTIARFSTCVENSTLPHVALADPALVGAGR